MEPSAKSYYTWTRFAGAGIELAGTSLAFALLGYGLDHWLGNEQLIATAFAALIGFSLGMIRFVMLASQVNANQKQANKTKASDDQPDPSI